MLLREQRVELAAQVVLQQPHERRDLALRALPVLDREGVEREHLEPEACRGLDRVAHRLDPGAVALDAVLLAQLRPAPVAVHDDRDVAREPLPVDRAQQVLFAGPGWHDLEQILERHGGDGLS